MAESRPPGPKLKLPDDGTTVARGNRMIHPAGTLSMDKGASATRTHPTPTVDPATSPSTPIIYGVRSV